MRKKLLGLAAALGITMLASWSVPAVAVGTGPCTGRFCVGELSSTPCICIQPPYQVITCGAWFQGGCS